MANRLFLDCRGTLDIYGTQLADAARKSGKEIVIWSWGSERTASEMGKRFFPSDKWTTAVKDFETPDENDIVVDDEAEYWSDPTVNKAKFYLPVDFIERREIDD